MLKISAVIITFNEEKYIEQCLKSVEEVADEIVVVDSLSSDRTPEICKRMGVRFIEQKFLGYKEQKNFALNQATHNFVLSLDADEALSVELKNEILKIKNSENSKYAGYYFNRLNNYCGQWIYHTIYYPEQKLRLFDRTKGEWGGLNPHDKFELRKGYKSKYLKGNLLHWFIDNHDEHIQKINKFSSISADSYFQAGRKSNYFKILFNPMFHFLRGYFVKLGILDGYNGFIISVLNSYMCFLKYIKLRDLILISKNKKKYNLSKVLIAGSDNTKTLKSARPSKVTVIITTFNNPEWLKKTLWSYEAQTYRNFEIIIADDGSDQETIDVIDWFKKTSKLEINHVWHPHNGFQKCTILNKAILESKTDYLIFTDGDCIARKDFIKVHIDRAKRNHFLSGGYFKLTSNISKITSQSDIAEQKPFNIKWLRNLGQPFTYKFLKMFHNPLLVWCLNTFTTTKATWNGHNVSGWKDDILRVNGYNEDMKYGGLDRELGERLVNIKVKGIQIRYSAICLHLDHPRPYKNVEALKKNRSIRDDVLKNKIVWATNGIVKEQPSINT